MIGWIKKLFGGIDRTEAAMDRAAKAVEDIAAAFESARDRLLERVAPADLPASLPPANGKPRRLAAAK